MSSSSEFIGSWVELHCGELGKYTGEIVSVSPDKITITKAQQDGKPCASVFVTFNGEFLQDMKLLDTPDNTNRPDVFSSMTDTQSQPAPHPSPCAQKSGKVINHGLPPPLSNLSIHDRAKEKKAAPPSAEAISKPNFPVTPPSSVLSIAHSVSIGVSGVFQQKTGQDRRDKLRNIPNTVTAYICPVSPPALRKICRRGDSEDSKRGITPENYQSVSWSKDLPPSNIPVHPLRQRSLSGDDMQLVTVGGPQDHTQSSRTGNSQRGQKKQRQQQQQTGRQRQQSWLFSDVEEVKREEFDFEGNLALFDKAAFYQQTTMTTITSAGQPVEHGDVVVSEIRPRNGTKNVSDSAKYKCSEFVLAEAITCPPVDSRELIRLPYTNANSSAGPLDPPSSWITDQGRRIPVLDDMQLRGRLFATADKMGLTWSKISEIAGRAIAEMIIQQLGGESRLSVTNLHQTPRVVVLLGRHKTGALGAAVARHLVSREIKVTICLPEWAIVDPFCALFATEFQLYKDVAAQDNVLRNPMDLPKTPVDFILSCIEEFDGSPGELSRDARAMFKWCEDNRAPLMTINPPAISSVKWKLCINLALPSTAHHRLFCRGREGNFWPPIGHVYLLDIGFTKMIYKELDINYLSPFGGKSIIVLHAPKSKR